MIWNFELDALGLELQAKILEVLNFKANVVNGGSDSVLSRVIGIAKTQIGARHVRCSCD